LPSLGLLLLRVVTAAVLLLRCVQIDRSTPLHTAAPFLTAAAAGLLLLLGSWTVVAGIVVVVVESFLSFTHTGDLSVSVLLAALGLALALLGPGGWSVDAQRFGWKRIEIRRPE